ncbi:MAG: hypothetical protein CMF45_00420 [Legionellales bacterium]|nr:hypothetical protein [Legionellales bacterium]
MVVSPQGKLTKVYEDKPITKVGRKPLPKESRRKMYSTRLHPKTISQLEGLRLRRNKPISRILEDLVDDAANES